MFKQARRESRDDPNSGIGDQLRNPDDSQRFTTDRTLPAEPSPGRPEQQAAQVHQDAERRQNDVDDDVVHEGRICAERSV